MGTAQRFCSSDRFIQFDCKKEEMYNEIKSVKELHFQNLWRITYIILDFLCFKINSF